MTATPSRPYSPFARSARPAHPLPVRQGPPPTGPVPAQRDRAEDAGSTQAHRSGAQQSGTHQSSTSGASVASGTSTGGPVPGPHGPVPAIPPSEPSTRPSRSFAAARDVLTLVALPVLAALVLPAAFAGGGTRRWFGGRAEGQRAEAQAAKDAAAAAFYELDTAQRDLRISIETITAVDDSPAARRAVSDFEALGRRIDEASQKYITAVDAHDLDRDELEASVAARARTELTAAKDELGRVKTELDRFEQGLGPLLGKAETQLARLAPAVERARQSLLAASNALDAVRQSGLRADDLAARLATLGPELTKLNQGAGQHGVPETLERAERVSREAGAVRAEAERLPERAAEIDHRLVSLRTSR